MSSEFEGSVILFLDNVKYTMFSAFERESSTRIEIGLEEAGSKFIQLIESARRTAAAGGRSIPLAGCVREVLDLLPETLVPVTPHPTAQR
jgi:hypothetical protein